MMPTAGGGNGASGRDRDLRGALPLAALMCWAAVPGAAACPGQTQLEMNACAAAAYRAADAELNSVWSQAKPFMDSIGGGAPLLDAQRKWLAFRDAACAAEIAPYGGGSIAPLVHSNCLRRLTERRTQDLRQLLSQ